MSLCIPCSVMEMCSQDLLVPHKHNLNVTSAVPTHFFAICIQKNLEGLLWWWPPEKAVALGRVDLCFSNPVWGLFEERKNQLRKKT